MCNFYLYDNRKLKQIQDHARGGGTCPQAQQVVYCRIIIIRRRRTIQEQEQEQQEDFA